MSTEFSWERYPVLGICGWSGSGKTTLLETIIPGLVRRGLRVAVIKHDAHGVSLDHPGKDSDRLFQAGADVFLSGPDQQFTRVGTAPVLESVTAVALQLLANHDLVLIEGHKDTPVPKIWLEDAAGDPAPVSTTEIRLTMPRDDTRAARAEGFILDWLEATWQRAPVLGGVLVGGSSSRMGQPKHLMSVGGKTFVETAVAALAPHVDRVVVLGSNVLPEALHGVAQVPDPPGLEGPLAGLVAAMRWAPLCNWVVTACDLPQVDAPAVAWLLGQRQPGRWAVFPSIDGKYPEPLLAFYDFRTRHLLEDMARRGLRAPRFLAEHPQVASPCPPVELHPCWQNVNTPEDYRRASTTAH